MTVSFQGVVVLVVFLAIFVGYVMHRKQSKDLIRCFEEQQRRRGGQIVPGSLFGLPSLDIEIAGETVTVTGFAGSSGSSRSPSAILACWYPSETRDFSFEIASDAFRFKMDAALGVGLAMVSHGQQAVDDVLVFRSNDEAAVRRLLKRPLVDHLLTLADRRILSITLGVIHTFTDAGWQDRYTLRCSTSPISTRGVDVDWLITTMELFIEALNELE